MGKKKNKEDEDDAMYKPKMFESPNIPKEFQGFFVKKNFLEVKLLVEQEMAALSAFKRFEALKLRQLENQVGRAPSEGESAASVAVKNVYGDETEYPFAEPAKKKLLTPQEVEEGLLSYVPPDYSTKQMGLSDVQKERRRKVLEDE